MTLDACAALVERGDPDRFAAVMAAPQQARPKLWPLYAFNLEVARAPWVTQQPLIAEMRLQFWRDMLEAKTPRAHEVAGPAHALLQETPGIAPLLDRVIEARRHDITREPFASDAAFEAYIEDTAATLMWAAALALGAEAKAEPAFRALGWAAGLANYLRAVPTLVARNLQPLPDADPKAIRNLAAEGLHRLHRARAARSSFGRASPAALAAWAAGPLLAQAFDNPTRVAEGTLALSEFRRRGGLLWMAATGRF
ncbi:MAG: squalene/phytoene synthase family protein [Cypionkella sp.]